MCNDSKCSGTCSINLETVYDKLDKIPDDKIFKLLTDEIERRGIDKCKPKHEPNPNDFPTEPKHPDWHDTVAMNTFTGDTADVFAGTPKSEVPMARGGVISQERFDEIMTHGLTGGIVTTPIPSVPEGKEEAVIPLTVVNYTPVQSSGDLFGVYPGDHTTQLRPSVNPWIIYQNPVIENIDPEIPKAQYSTKGSAGLDLYTRTEVTLSPSKSLAHAVTKIPLNVKIDMKNQNFYSMLLPRSSTCLKYGIMLANNCGVIDSDYTDEIALLAYNFTDHSVTIPKGTKIAQLLFMQQVRIGLEEAKVETTDEHAGFGSTGK